MDIMTEKLPISIQVSDDLVVKIENISSVSNKLEAQLNFHTMTANWYGEEEHVLQINFYLCDISELGHCGEDEGNSLKKEFLADDVLMVSSENRLVDCYVAITASELLLLQRAPKLLSGYLGKKLTKVLNLIAKRWALEAI